MPLLLIGAGNMAQPLMLSLLRDNVAELHIICGKSKGKDARAIESLIRTNGLENSRHRLFTRGDSLPAAHYHAVIYGAKPQQMARALPAYTSLLNAATPLIHFCAGMELAQVAAIENLPPCPIIRTMPHLPLRVFAITGTDANALKVSLPLLKGFGEAIKLDDESLFHPFTALAGSSPALLAEILRQAPEEAPSLKAHQGGIYEAWWHYGRRFFDAATSAHIIDETITGTFAVLAETGESYANFIARVRSKKGTTNAGLLFLGNPPPHHADFGTAAQLKAQNAIAETYHRRQPALAEAFTHSLEAVEARSRNMACSPDDPLGGLLLR